LMKEIRGDELVNIGTWEFICERLGVIVIREVQ
jgi:hypothetical protein